MNPEHAQAHGKAQEGIKEVANAITLMTEKWHGTPWAHFLHRWENVIFSWFIALVLIAVALLGTRKRHLVPTPFQNFLEGVVETLENFILEVLGPRGKKFVPFVGTLFLYILFQNLSGIIPGLKASTSSLNTTVALAVTVFFYVQWTGIRENGILGYFDHLMGNPRDFIGWILVPLNLPLHILEEFIKPLSLSLRLFGNILGEDALIASFVALGILAGAFMHLPVGLPIQLPFMMLACITGTIQALVFALLCTIYISLMLPHEDHPHHQEPNKEVKH